MIEIADTIGLRWQGYFGSSLAKAEVAFKLLCSLQSRFGCIGISQHPQQIFSWRMAKVLMQTGNDWLQIIHWGIFICQAFMADRLWVEKLAGRHCNRLTTLLAVSWHALQHGFNKLWWVLSCKGTDGWNSRAAAGYNIMVNMFRVTFAGAFKSKAFHVFMWQQQSCAFADQPRTLRQTQTVATLMQLDCEVASQQGSHFIVPPHLRRQGVFKHGPSALLHLKAIQLATPTGETAALGSTLEKLCLGHSVSV